MHLSNLSQNCSSFPLLADTVRTEVAYLSVHVFGGGDIYIENISGHDLSIV